MNKLGGVMLWIIRTTYIWRWWLGRYSNTGKLWKWCNY